MQLMQLKVAGKTVIYDTLWRRGQCGSRGRAGYAGGGGETQHCYFHAYLAQFLNHFRYAYAPALPLSLPLPYSTSLSPSFPLPLSLILSYARGHFALCNGRQGRPRYLQIMLLRLTRINFSQSACAAVAFTSPLPLHFSPSFRPQITSKLGAGRTCWAASCARVQNLPLMSKCGKSLN